VTSICDLSRADRYSASHSRVAPENVGLQKEQKCNTFASHTCNEVRLSVLGIPKKEVGETKRLDKIKMIMTKRYDYATFLPLALSVCGVERCEVLACLHVVMKMYRYSLEERVFILKTYWITGSIKKYPPSKRCIQLLLKSLSYLILSCYQLPFCEFPKHYRYDMQMYCTFVLFVNEHFPGLPASGTHYIR
jgi:hypothetical protein